MASPDQNVEGGGAGFFVPMVDMLAGVIFILIIMLVSVALLARDDYAKVEAAQKEIAAIEKELEAARAAEATYLQPRRQASEALRAVLRRISDDLAAAGISSSIEKAPDRLRLEGSDFFDGDVSLSTGGARAASALSGALARSLPCLTDLRPMPQCADVPDARAARVAIAVHSPSRKDDAIDAQSRTDLQSVDLFAAVGRDNPALASLRNPAGQKLLGYAGYGDSVLAKEQREGAERIDLVFEMFVPPLPDQQ